MTGDVKQHIEGIGVKLKKVTRKLDLKIEYLNTKIKKLEVYQISANRSARSKAAQNHKNRAI